MEFQHVFLIIAMTCGVQSARNPGPHTEPEEHQCDLTCAECFTNSLHRIACFEKCIAVGMDHFTCPGSVSFLIDVAHSQELQADVEKFYEKQSQLWSANDIEGIVATCAMVVGGPDCIVVIDHLEPVIGPAERAKQAIDFFKANPEVDRYHYEPVDFGREDGITWINGFVDCFDKQDRLVVGIRIMSLLRRDGGELKEFTRVLFVAE